MLYLSTDFLFEMSKNIFETENLPRPGTIYKVIFDSFQNLFLDMDIISPKASSQVIPPVFNKTEVVEVVNGIPLVKQIKDPYLAQLILKNWMGPMVSIYGGERVNIDFDQYKHCFIRIPSHVEEYIYQLVNKTKTRLKGLHILNYFLLRNFKHSFEHRFHTNTAKSTLASEFFTILGTTFIVGEDGKFRVMVSIREDPVKIKTSLESFNNMLKYHKVILDDNQLIVPVRLLDELASRKDLLTLATI